MSANLDGFWGIWYTETRYTTKKKEGYTMLDFIEKEILGQLHWTEVFYAAFGSFIGIFVPMWIDKWKSRKEEREARAKLMAGLKRELDSVKQLIEDCAQQEHQYDIFSFSTFVWESIIAAGMLPDILADKKMNGELLMEIYSDLSLLEELHDEFCQCEKPEDLRDIYEGIKVKRSEIYDKICRYQTPGNTR